MIQYRYWRGSNDHDQTRIRVGIQGEKLRAYKDLKSLVQFDKKYILGLVFLRTLQSKGKWYR